MRLYLVDRPNLGELMHPRILLPLLLAITASAECRAISIRHDIPEQDYFNLAAEFPAAGSLFRQGGQFCTASLVAPDKILTAAHCTFGGAGAYQFRLGDNSSTPTHTRSVTAYVDSPNYNGSEASDLSVMTLSSPINDVTPMPISMQDPDGLVGTMIGFGLHGTGTTFNGAFDPLKRAAQNVIALATPSTVRTDFDHPSGATNTYAPATALPLEGTTASGDSGGALTVDFGGGEAIVGVLSWGFNNFGPDSRYGDISIWAPIDRAQNISFLEAQGLTVLGDFVSGDFEPDGTYDCSDVNLLTAAVADGLNEVTFDLTGDGLVNVDDLDEWLAVAGSANLPSGNPYLKADINLDGTVDGLDFIGWNTHKFTANNAYCSGDVNADGFVDGNDFITWNQNKFQSADALGANLNVAHRPGFGAVVPEPCGIVLAIMGWMLLAVRRP